MNNKGNIVKRLTELKQETIINNSENINFDNDIELYNVLIEKLLAGNFDEVFLSDYLIGIDSEEKSEIFQLARKYSNLCFFQGNPSYWVDSIEGTSLSDYELIVMKILDNFDFLLCIAKDGGEASLKQLDRFAGIGDVFSDHIIIDYLRCIFTNDDLLKDIIIEMSNTDGEYKDYSDYQKAVLMTFPEGLLYKKSKEEVKRVPAKELEARIKNYLMIEKHEDVSQFSQFSSILELLDNEYYSDMIVEIFYDTEENFFSK